MTGTPMNNVLISIDINVKSVELISVVAFKTPTSNAPNANASSRESSTIPKAILILFLLSKVINSV
jgi:hypothetical protein